MKNPNNVMPYLTKSWNEKWRWPFSFISDHIEVTAWQTLLPNQDSMMPTPVAEAKILVRRNNIVVLSDSIDFPMFATDAGLLMQVFILSTMPDYRGAEWQPTLEEFCRSFEAFEEPTQIYWSKAGQDPLFD